MPVLDVDGWPLWYAVGGRSGGPTLLALHGFTGSHRTFVDGWPYVERRGWRWLAPDLPGHGQSGIPDRPERLRLAATAQDLLRLPLPDRFHLLGYSLGGRLALWLAAAVPDRIVSLVLESASPGLDLEAERKAREAQDARLAETLEKDGLAAFIEAWERQPLFAHQRWLTPDRWRALARERRRHQPQGLAMSLRGSGTGSQPSLWPALPRLTFPTLLVAGVWDAKYVAMARLMAARLPESSLCLIDGAGHTPHWERPDNFWAEVEAFWDSLAE
jgi:2-succinyl-6-hydroxy-2,4-cyclohexadiene-1-carboxylate synthase